MTSPDLSKLEPIISSLYGPSPSPDIISYCDNLKHYYLSTPSQISDLFTTFTTTTNPHLSFWLLDVLITLITTSYPSLDASTKAFIRSQLINIINNHISCLNTLPFVANKFSLLFIIWLKHDYPEQCPSFLQDILTCIWNTVDQALKLKKLNTFLDVLITFDDELIKFRHTYTDYEGSRSTIIKDYLRIHLIKDINNVLYQIISNDQYVDASVVIKSIKVIAQLIDWNSLEIFNELLATMLTKLISNGSYLSAILEVLNAVVKKGMEPAMKIDVIKRININTILHSVVKDNNIPDAALEISAEIVNNIGLFVHESYETIKTNIIMLNKGLTLMNGVEISQQSCDEALAFTNEQLNFCFQCTIAILNHKKFEYKTANQFIDYLSNIITYLKSNELLITGNDTLKYTFWNLFIEIEKLLMIPKHEYSLFDDLSKREDDEYFSFRKDFATLYRNIYNMSTYKSSVLDSIISKSTAAYLNNNVYHIEHLLYLIDIVLIQSNLTLETKSEQPYSEKLNHIVSLLFTFPFHETNSDYVLISYYETICKILSHLTQNIPALEYVLMLFLGKHGICCDNAQTGIRVVSLFDKFLSKTKSHLHKLNCISTAVITVKSNIETIVNSNRFLLVIEYALLFHCLSILVSTETNVEAKKQNYETALQLFITLFTKYQHEIDKFCEIMKCLTQFLKNFNTEIKDETVRTLYMNFFDAFIFTYCNNVLQHKQHKCLYAMITILQRILIILGNNAEKYINYFYAPMNGFITHEIFEDAIKLIQNYINTCKRSTITFIQKHFVMFYNVIQQLQMPVNTIAESDKNVVSCYANFVKLMFTICVETPEVFVIGVDGVEIEMLFALCRYIAVNAVEGSLRRSVVRMERMFCEYLKKNERQLCSNQMVLRVMKCVLDGTFDVFKRINVNEPLDSSTMCEMSVVHFCCSEFKEWYCAYIKAFMNEEQANAFYAMIAKVSPNQIRLSSDIVGAFNVS